VKYELGTSENHFNRAVFGPGCLFAGDFLNLNIKPFTVLANSIYIVSYIKLLLIVHKATYKKYYKLLMDKS